MLRTYRKVRVKPEEISVDKDDILDLDDLQSVGSALSLQGRLSDIATCAVRAGLPRITDLVSKGCSIALNEVVDNDQVSVPDLFSEERSDEDFSKAFDTQLDPSIPIESNGELLPFGFPPLENLLKSPSETNSPISDIVSIRVAQIVPVPAVVEAALTLPEVKESEYLQVTKQDIGLGDAVVVEGESGLLEGTVVGLENENLIVCVGGKGVLVSSGSVIKLGVSEKPGILNLPPLPNPLPAQITPQSNDNINEAIQDDVSEDIPSLTLSSVTPNDQRSIYEYKKPAFDLPLPKELSITGNRPSAVDNQIPEGLPRLDKEKVHSEETIINRPVSLLNLYTFHSKADDRPVDKQIITDSVMADQKIPSAINVPVSTKSPRNHPSNFPTLSDLHVFPRRMKLIPASPMPELFAAPAPIRPPSMLGMSVRWKPLRILNHCDHYLTIEAHNDVSLIVRVLSGTTRNLRLTVKRVVYILNLLRGAHHPSLNEIIGFDLISNSELIKEEVIGSMVKLTPSDQSLCLYINKIEGLELTSAIKEHRRDLRVDEKERGIKPHIVRVLSALQLIHSKGLPHRQVLARNIFTNVNLESTVLREVYIDLRQPSETDFGVDSFLKIGPDVIYAAPETFSTVCSDLRPADIWQLGLVIIELISGSPPLWKSDLRNPLVIGTEIAVSEDLPHIPVMSHKCKDFLKRCLIKDPVKRATAEELTNHSWFS